MLIGTQIFNETPAKQFGLCRILDFNGKISRNINYLRRDRNTCIFSYRFCQLRDFFVNNNIHGFFYLRPDLAVVRP